MLSTWTRCYDTFPTTNAYAASATNHSSTSPMRRFATFANTINSCALGWPAIANAHAVLASSYVLKLAMRCSATLANAVNSCASLTSTL